MEVKDRIYQIIAKAQEKLSAHNIKLSVDESAEVTKEETAEALKNYAHHLIHSAYESKP